MHFLFTANEVVYISLLSSGSNGSTSTSAFTHLTYQLTDLNGKLISTQPIAKALTAVDIRGLSAGVYFLKVEGKTFRVLKE